MLRVSIDRPKFGWVAIRCSDWIQWRVILESIRGDGEVLVEVPEPETRNPNVRSEQSGIEGGRHVLWMLRTTVEVDAEQVYDPCLTNDMVEGIWLSRQSGRGPKLANNGPRST